MRCVLSLFILLLSSQFCDAQFKLNGIIKANNGRALEFAKVALYEDSTYVDGAYSDSTGYFAFASQKSATYQLKVSCMNYGEEEITLTISKDTTINITLDSIEKLNEITINGSKRLIIRKVDRLVFNVENAIAANTGDAIDALKVTPGVKVQNDQISIIGKNDVSVMLNGRIIQLSGSDLANYLKSISGSNIASIEVITTPPSKYEVQGSSGLINIILKKGIQNSWNDNMRMTYNQTTYPSLAIGNTFQYSKNKIKMLASIDGKVGKEGVLEDDNIFYPSEKWEQVNERKDNKNYVSGYASIDYELTSKNSVGLQYFGSYKKPDQKNTFNAKIENTDPELNYRIGSSGLSDVNNNFNSLNLHWLHNIDTMGKKCSIDVDYFNYQLEKNRDFQTNTVLKDGTQTDFSSSLILSNQKIVNLSSKLDFEYPTKLAKFTYGAKASMINTNSNIKFYNTTSGHSNYDPLQSDQFNYEENNQALYLDVEKEINAKWQGKIGLRLENTQTKGTSISYSQINKNNYTKLFPVFYLQYTISKENSLNFNYSKRIDRPSFGDLNPFKWYLNSVSYAVGNPFLQPSYVNNFELSHIFKDKLVSQFTLSVTNNGFSQIPAVDSINYKQIFTRQNFFKLYEFGLSESYTFDRFWWWQSYNQVTVNYFKSSFKENIVNTAPQNGFSLMYTTNNSFVITKDKSVLGVVNFWYNTPYKALLYENGKSYNLDLGVRKFLLHRKLQLVLFVTDVFKSSVPVSTTYTNGIKQKYYVNFDTRAFRIVLRYSLGSDKVSNRLRNTGNQEEVNRSSR